MATKANLPEKPEVKRELRTVPLDWLKPYENNPRIIENAVPLVEESMRQVGYVTPIVADEDGVILAGHTRFAALKELGKTEVPQDYDFGTQSPQYVCGMSVPPVMMANIAAEIKKQFFGK